ncbi:MAG: hypothetical protein HF973_14240 [Chloroflexi bacterium]|nr:hypothetical protein [Chloroflexota bacterium]
MKKRTPIILLLFILLAACRQGNDAVPTRMPTAVIPNTAPETTKLPKTAVSPSPSTPQPLSSPSPLPPTATPLPAKEITICMAGEPESVYLYGDDSLAATAVRHAIYENLITTLDYAYQPQGITTLPSLDRDDAALKTVRVRAGDRIVDASGKAVNLRPGTQIVLPDGELHTFSGEEDEPVEMQQMVVDFTLQPLVWSDGTAVTADDSVFSFEVAADLDTPGSKHLIDRTAGYKATGDLTLRWTGLPGYLDPAYFANVWTPLPRHQLGDYTAADLLTLPEAAQTPLSSGPFVLAEWQPGRMMRLERNPHYYRTDEGFPAVDQLTVHFGLDGTAAVTAVASGPCDIITHDALNREDIPTLIEADDSLIPYFSDNLVFENIDFGIDSWEQYGDDLGRPDWFEFVPVRQAIAQCLDRQAMVDELFAGQTHIMNAYIPDEHPLFPDDAVIWPYDPDVGNALLDEFGLEDTDGDGFRELVERDIQAGIVATTTFSITLGANSESVVRTRVNEMVQADLAECGIRVSLYDVPAEKWFDDGPFSPLFGRRFDLATYAWLTGITPPCGLYLSGNITGPEEQGFGGWGNVNATGWANEEYDAACQTALDALPGTDEYTENHQEAVRIFTERLPAIPLFQYVNTAVTHPSIRSFQPNPTQPSELWNIFEIDKEE